MLESSNLLSSFSVEGYIMGSACWVWASLYWYTILCHLWMPSVLLICIVTLSYGHNLMFSMKCPISAAIHEYCMNYQIVWLSIINNCVPKALFNIPPRECSFEDVQGHCISRINVPFITCHIRLNLLTTRMILSQIQKRPHSPLVRASYGVFFFKVYNLVYILYLLCFVKFIFTINHVSRGFQCISHLIIGLWHVYVPVNISTNGWDKCMSSFQNQGIIQTNR